VGRVQTTIVGMKAEIDRVVDRIGYGELGARGEEGGFQGGYAELVRGVNFMADTYTGYIDETPAPIIIIDREMGLVFANRAAREAVGLDLEAIAGRKCHELMRTGDCKTPDCACARAMQTNAKQESETIARPGDAEMDIRYVGVPIVKDGEVVGAFEIVMDQTAIKQSQRTMQGVAERAEQLAEHLASSSQELAAQVEQIARGSETQRSRMEETATAMEQMNTSVREVADNAGSASAGASETMQQAVEGADAVRRVVSGIDEVREMTQKLKADIEGLGAQADNIGNVITVIEDIADQTNLLALNAAIEAARAGDAGRGFAVVADEVRKLAEKTMEATKQVAHNISAIQTAVRESQDKMASAATTVDSVTDVAGESGRSLEEIVRLMETNAGQVEGIATASEEQSASSEEINRAVEDVRRIVEETSEGMRQSSRAVEELAQMSGELNTLIEDLQKA
jgi:methyl-accepting chemotaxis protein